GRWSDVRDEDVNSYLKEIVGDDFSAKDFRTWSATVLAALGVAVASPAASKTAGRRLATAICKEVSEQLGNTPAVCRSSYIDPRVFDHHQGGETIAEAVSSLAGEPDVSRPRVRAAIEEAVVTLLDEENAGPAQPGRSKRPSRSRSASSSTSERSRASSKSGKSASTRRRASSERAA
ncbi:MAG: hypothetical protein ACRDZP_02330, partial [Acidimicrobiales bacterium]